MHKPSALRNTIPDPVYLWIAVLIFASSSAVTRRITEIGAQNLIEGRNPISLCNVLFVGNLCALMVMLPLFGRAWQRQNLSRLSRRDWLGLGAIALFSGAIGPSLIFAALDNTTVTSVVLISRLEPPLILALSVLFLKVSVNLWTIAGSLLSFVGVAASVLLFQSEQMISVMGGMMQIGKGELQVAIAAVILAIAAIISKIQLQSVPLGIFNIFRTALGTIIFFVLALWLYGAEHFADVLQPIVWQWMLLYGILIVAVGQLCWFRGLRSATTAEITLANSLNPIAAIGFAYLILGEVPTMAQYIGGGIILMGLLLSAIGNIRHSNQANLAPTTTPEAMEIETGFRGV
jgi:drug/metabolite transporter (DMT)-like permease